MHIWNEFITVAASLYGGGVYGHAVAGAHSTGLLDLLGSILAQQATPTVTASATVEAVQGAPVGPEAMKPIVMIRGLILGAVGFVLAALVGKPVINWLRDRGIGKHIRIEGPASHQVKTGTPTMGGLIFLIPLVVVITVFMDLLTFKSLLLPLGIVISCGILGGVDDLMSIVGRNRGGMTARFKMAWLLAISTIAACILYFLLDWHGLFVPFITTATPISIGIFYIPIAIFVIAGCANAVNFTDGLDSLAGGTSAIAFVSYGVIAFLQRQPQIVYLCFTEVGVLLAFLWFNAYPAMA
ncbi:MAG: hypothetical protein ABJA50_04635, partial [Chloroflexota bacterium]